jgi:hypothetical protein
MIEENQQCVTTLADLERLWDEWVKFTQRASWEDRPIGFWPWLSSRANDPRFVPLAGSDEQCVICGAPRDSAAVRPAQPQAVV